MKDYNRHCTVLSSNELFSILTQFCPNYKSMNYLSLWCCISYFFLSGSDVGRESRVKCFSPSSSSSFLDMGFLCSPDWLAWNEQRSAYLCLSSAEN